MDIFALAERLPTSVTLPPTRMWRNQKKVSEINRRGCLRGSWRVRRLRRGVSRRPGSTDWSSWVILKFPFVLNDTTTYFQISEVWILPQLVLIATMVYAAVATSFLLEWI